MVYDCQQCAEEHEQLAEWLEELKDLRKCVKSKAFTNGYNKGRTDGIDECINMIKKYWMYWDIGVIAKVIEVLEEFKEKQND